MGILMFIVFQVVLLILFISIINLIGHFKKDDKYVKSLWDFDWVAFAIVLVCCVLCTWAITTSWVLLFLFLCVTFGINIGSKHYFSAAIVFIGCCTSLVSFFSEEPMLEPIILYIPMTLAFWVVVVSEYISELLKYNSDDFN